MYLNKDSFDVEIVSSKSSEMNVMLPTPSGDDYVSFIFKFYLIFLKILFFSFKVESPIPEQFKTVVAGNSLQTTCVESLG